MAARQGRSSREWRTSRAVLVEMNDGSNWRNSVTYVTGAQANILRKFGKNLVKMAVEWRQRAS